MFVVYATGQYITGANDAGGLCDTVTFQQDSKPLVLALHQKIPASPSCLCFGTYLVPPTFTCKLATGINGHNVTLCEQTCLHIQPKPVTSNLYDSVLPLHIMAPRSAHHGTSKCTIAQVYCKL